MADLFDYITWRGDLSFQQDPPNEVDALIFSGLSYICYCLDRSDQCILREAAVEFMSHPNSQERLRLKNDLELLKAAAETRRFGECVLCEYADLLIPEEETQFAAIAFLLDDNSAFLSFRGTDETLTGWKEDFNMSFQDTVPSQRLALSYTEVFAQKYANPFRMAGHSKGGNLAVFAASCVSAAIQQRIIAVYNHDGPGFGDYLMGNPGYKAIVPKIKTYVPQSSVIGMLLEHEEPYKVIRSNQISLLQHDFYSWEVLGKHFVEMEDITADSRFLDLTIKNWISEMTVTERNILVDALFDLLASGEVSSAMDIFQLKNIRHYLKALSSDGSIRKLFSSEMRSLIEAARKAKNQFDYL